MEKGVRNNVEIGQETIEPEEGQRRADGGDKGSGLRSLPHNC